MLHICIDNGHGDNTSGKRSPDGRLREYKYCREIAKMLKAELDKYSDFDAIIITPEEYDVEIEDRCSRTNEICSRYGSDNCIFLSIHNNAAGLGKEWMSAQGWSGWVYRKASENTKLLANLLYDACTKLGIKANKPLPSQKYWDCGFYVCKHTKCPAVLTENLFQDNKSDVDFLLSEEGKRKIVQLHLNAIIMYYKEKFKKEPAIKETIGYGGCNLK